jgi:hypothetical protein
VNNEIHRKNEQEKIEIVNVEKQKVSYSFISDRNHIRFVMLMFFFMLITLCCFPEVLVSVFHICLLGC